MLNHIQFPFQDLPLSARMLFGLAIIIATYYPLWEYKRKCDSQH